MPLAWADMATPPYPGGEQERRHGAEPPYPDPRPAGLDAAASAALGDPLVAVSFSDWWSKVVAVLARSWRALLVIQLATVVPGMIIGALVTAAGRSDSTVVSVAGALLGLAGAVVVFVVTLLAQGVSVYVVAKQASDAPVGAGPALTFAAGRALPLLGWGIVAGLLVMVGFVLLVLPGLYLVVVFAAALSGVIMFERAGIGRTFRLVNPAFGQTLGRLLSFALVAAVYGAVAGFVATALAGREGLLAELLGKLFTLPITFAAVGVGVVTYASLRNREDPGVTTPVLAAELDRP